MGLGSWVVGSSPSSLPPWSRVPRLWGGGWGGGASGLGDWGVELETNNGNGKLARELAKRILLQGQSLALASKGLGIPLSLVHQLVQSQTFQDTRLKLASNAPEASDGSLEQDMKRVEGMRGEAISRISRVMEEAEDDKLAWLAATDILDRSGIPKQNRIEAKHTIELSKETMQLLTRAMGEQDAIELSRSDWSYAADKPVDFRVGERITARESEGAVAIPSETIDLLHGESDCGVSGLRSRSPRDDGRVDRKADDEEAGLSPA